jgi:uncharacterized membrane protein
VNSSRNLLTLIAAFGLAGLSAASSVFVTHSLGYTLFCPFATGCDAVQNSPYAVLLGIPVSFLGMMGFSAYIALALIGLRSDVATSWYFKALLVLSVVEVGFTSYMAYLQVAVIRAVCSWCMLSAGLTVVLAALVIYAMFGTAKATRASLGR